MVAQGHDSLRTVPKDAPRSHDFAAVTLSSRELPPPVISILAVRRGRRLDQTRGFFTDPRCHPRPDPIPSLQVRLLL